MTWRMLAITLLVLPLGGCIDWFYKLNYDQFDTGKLKGKLIVEWIDQDKFVFVPDPEKPLTFERKNGEVIRPQRMYTDGGSVPRALRVLKSYSPWGYAPAFIVHDWLFVMKQCQLAGYEKYDVEKAATIMAEAMKTVMENPKYGGPNALVHYSMYQAVRSDAAKAYWDKGKCETPTGTRAGARALNQFSNRSGTPRPRFVISFE